MATKNTINCDSVGLTAYDGIGNFFGRTLVAGSGISISNSNGVTGDPVISAGGAIPVSFTTDSGTAIPALNNINEFGSGSITTVGSGSTITTQLTGLTNHAVLVGAGTTTITKLAVGTNGQVLIAATAADPAFATLSSSDSSITFTTGANTLSLQVTGGTSVGKTITGDSGGALSPTAGNWNLLGTGSITTSGSGSTLTTQLTGLTNHAILVGAGTATITKIAATANTGAVLQNNSGADPSYSTATYPSTATGTGTILRADGTNWTATTSTYPSTNAVSTLLYASSSNVMSALATANDGVLITSNTGVPSWLANGSTGQLLTATTGSPPSWTTVTASGVQTLTGDTGGAISPSAGNITLAGSGSITTAGSGSTITTQLTGLTNHNVLIGAGTTTITKVAPSATSGVALISQGSSADPVFGTVVVAGGGTGAVTLTGVLIGNGTSAVTASTITQYGTVVAGASNTVSSIAPSATSGIPYISQGASANPTFGTAVVGGGGTGNTTFTAYSVIAAGTTATGAFQNVSGVGTAGQVLSSNGASALPTWQTAPSGVFSPSSVLQEFDDFIGYDAAAGAGQISKLMWTSQAGTIVPVDGTAGHPGTLNWSAGGASINFHMKTVNGASVANPILLGSGAISVNFVCNITTLSVLGNRYTFRIGMSTSTSATADFTNGVYFEYSDNINSGNLVLKANDTSGPASSNSTTPMATGWHNLGITVNAAASSVEYFFDGVSLGTVATHIPVVAIRPTIQLGIVSGSLTAFALDLFYMSQIFTTPR